MKKILVLLAICLMLVGCERKITVVNASKADVWNTLSFFAIRQGWYDDGHSYEKGFFRSLGSNTYSAQNGFLSGVIYQDDKNVVIILDQTNMNGGYMAESVVKELKRFWVVQ